MVTIAGIQVNKWKINTSSFKLHFYAQLTLHVSSCEINAWRKFRLERDSNPWPLQYWSGALPTELSSQQGAGHAVNRIQTLDLYDSGVVFHQLSYQANRELVTLWVHNIPVARGAGGVLPEKIGGGVWPASQNP